jgi:hypothetical protein
VNAVIEQPEEGLDLYSETGNHSLFRLLNGCQATLRAIEQIPHELMEKSEPDDTQMRLKIAFWNEYRRAIRIKDKVPQMVLNKVLFGVCSHGYWKNQVCQRPEVLAWVITPPTEEILVWQELLELGHKKLRRALKLPLVEKRYWKDKAGEVHVERRANVSLVKEVRSIVEMLQNRLHGSIIQKQEIQSKNLHLHSGDGGPTGKSAPEEMAEINGLIKRLEKLTAKVPGLPEVIVEGEIPEDPE